MKRSKTKANQSGPPRNSRPSSESSDSDPLDILLRDTGVSDNIDPTKIYKIGDDVFLGGKDDKKCYKLRIAHGKQNIMRELEKRDKNCTKTSIVTLPKGMKDDLKDILDEDNIFRQLLKNKDKSELEISELERPWKRRARKSLEEKKNVPRRQFAKCMDYPTECANCVLRLVWRCNKWGYGAAGRIKTNTCFQPCDCPGCNRTLKRCSACLIVAYCSVKCQKLHWKRGHKKFCKVMSWKEEGPTITHDESHCKYCTSFKFLRSNDSNFRNRCACMKDMKEQLGAFWGMFGYRHSHCGCKKPEDAYDQFPMQFPFKIGEFCGEDPEMYEGPIDEILANMFFLLNNIDRIILGLNKAGYEEKAWIDVLDFITDARLKYWYLRILCNADMIMETVFANMFFKDLARLNSAHGGSPIILMDSLFRKCGMSRVKPNVPWIWEIVLQLLSLLIRILRDAKYKSIQMKHKAFSMGGKYREIMQFTHFMFTIEDELFTCGSLPFSTEDLIKYTENKEKYLTAPLFVTLPPESYCVTCNEDHSGEVAQYLLQSPNLCSIWRPSGTDHFMAKRRFKDSSGMELRIRTLQLHNMLYRHEKLPIIFKDNVKDMSENTRKQIICCNKVKCIGECKFSVHKLNEYNFLFSWSCYRGAENFEPGV